MALGSRTTIVSELERLHAELDAARRGHRGSIVIGAFSSAIPVLLPPLISHFRTAYPEVSIEVREGAGSDMLTELDAGTVDLAIAVIHNEIPPLKHANYAQEFLFENAFDLVVRADHWAAKEPRVAFNSLASERWIMGDESTCRGSILRSHALANGFIPDIRSSCTDWRATVALVSAGLGIGAWGRIGRGNLPADLRIVPFENKVAQTVSMIARRDSPEHPLISAAADYIRNHKPHEGTRDGAVPALALG